MRTREITEEQFQKRDKKWDKEHLITEELKDLNLSIDVGLAEESWWKPAIHIWCECLFCGKVWEPHINNYKERPFCPACHKKEIEEDLRYRSELLFYEKAKEVHGDKYLWGGVNYVNAGTPVDIYCKKHNKLFQKSPNNHTSRKQGCPDCSLEELADRYIQERAKTFFIDAGKYWDNQFDYTGSVYKGAHKNITFKCTVCDTIQEATPSNHIHITHPTGCTGCNGSKGELRIKEILKKYHINYTPQKSFPDCCVIRPLRFDFYLPDYDLLIEYHGQQHYKAVDFFGGEEGFKRRQEYDKIKADYAKENHNFLVFPYNTFKDMEKLLLTKIKELTNGKKMG